VKTELCDRRIQHERHEWYWRNILRRDCPGLVVDHCGQNSTHTPHWHGEHHNEWCQGGGLAGRCAHGIQMLDHCDDCTDNPDPQVQDVLEVTRRERLSRINPEETS
jgi:hypothetical protein